MRFYYLSADLGRTKKYAIGMSIGEYPIQQINCSSCGEDWTKELIFTNESDHNIKIALSNSNFPDFLSYEIFSTFINTKVKELLIKNNMTNFLLKNVVIKASTDLTDLEKKRLRNDNYTSAELKRISDSPIEYYHLFVKGKAKLDLNKSELITDVCTECGSIHIRTTGDNPIDSGRAKYLDLEGWDGSDLFKVDIYPSRIFCTEKFYNLYNENKLTGLFFDEVFVG
ncbi:hypothetical protein PAECIP111891_07011 [Paenibacillus allorhizoplanae]|uniref:GIY-YIG nuclease family protein n=1 Tax=Paenibacillus allorhizoplanae TaxID=2905648 RepID=A0ABN8HBE1_9BACL|nr:hypothetical protein [Paenibacillus allorhizoplanae]CAH1232459.1 hypothetical protein PAECIP111891_07011 [Paenibacillus allorhizoplanae]